MKKKSFNEKYEKKVKKIDKIPKRYVDFKWVITISVCAFLMSIIFSCITETVVPRLNAMIGIVLVLFIIIIGVMFDMVGVAVTAADLKPFNSMATKKIRGSKTAIFLIQNAEKVSAFCNDVVGDVCGIISGSVGVLISLVVSSELNLNNSVVSLVLTAVIAALTIGGKAMGKSYAINKSDVIIFRFSKIVCFFKREAK